MLKGTGTALITPFLRNGEIDIKALENIVEHNITGACDFLVVMGTTSEYSTLTHKERLLVIDTISKTNKNRVPMVLGIGGNNTSEVLSEIQNTDLNPFYAILSVVPYYNRPTQEGIYAHFSAIAGVCPIPIILYNIPSRTGANMTADTTLRLVSSFDNIIGIKEASGDMEQYMTLIKNKKENFAVYSGDDALSVPVTLMGGSGVISVASNAFPFQISKMIHRALEGDVKKATDIHYHMLDFIHLLFSEGNPTGVKTALNLMGICQDTVRLPMVEGSSHLRKEIERFLSC